MGEVLFAKRVVCRAIVPLAPAPASGEIPSPDLMAAASDGETVPVRASGFVRQATAGSLVMAAQWCSQAKPVSTKSTTSGVRFIGL